MIIILNCLFIEFLCVKLSELKWSHSPYQFIIGANLKYNCGCVIDNLSFIF